jgi:hypothetical protein
MESAVNNPIKKRRLAEETPIEKELDGAVLESLYVKWISTDNKALCLVECPKFRAFLTYLNSTSIHGYQVPIQQLVSGFLTNMPSSRTESSNASTVLDLRSIAHLIFGLHQITF